jgi:transposase
MTAEERIAQLESENAALRGENAALREERAILVQQLEHLLARLEEVEGRLAKDSHNSSKPPSSDGPARKRGSRRAKSGKPFPVAWGT